MTSRRILKTAALLLTLPAALLSCALVQGPNTAAPDLGLTLPAGFHAEIYAGGFKKPRMMVTAPNGDIFVADDTTGQVSVLLDRDNNGKLDSQSVFASGLTKPSSLAFHGGYLYVGDTDAVLRFPYASGDLKASAGPDKIVDLVPGGKHYSRTVVFGPDDKLYVASGSDCNVCEEADSRRAAVWIYDADGKNGRPYAIGLRNAVGLEWLGNTLYATANGRDMAGNDTPPESFFIVKDGANYGWPYCYPVAPGSKQVWDKEFGKKDQAYCDAAQPSIANTTAHAAPLGLAFYTGKSFPAQYQGQMFVALHGSWNRVVKSGYKVVTIDPQTGEVRDFVTGFVKANVTTTARPVDLQVTGDGSLLLSDDGNGLIYRIYYRS